jgi:hypothetical protein
MSERQAGQCRRKLRVDPDDFVKQSAGHFSVWWLSHPVNQLSGTYYVSVVGISMSVISPADGAVFEIADQSRCYSPGYFILDGQ